MIARFTLKSFGVAGDRNGQHSKGVRFPFGPVGLITPFNFPLEIPALQLIGGILSGNKVLLKPCSRVNLVCEQLVHDLLYCGLDPKYIDLVHADRQNVDSLFSELKNILRVVQFTGSSRVAEHLMKTFNGKVRIEDRYILYYMIFVD